MQQVMAIPHPLLHESLRIEFAGEQGVDGGGLFREWTQLLCLEFFAPSRGLFQITQATDVLSYWINPSSGTLTDNHLEVGFVSFYLLFIFLYVDSVFNYSDVLLVNCYSMVKSCQLN